MRARADQDARYTQAVAEHGPALQRLAAAVEANPERRRDLLQDMHVALWRSFAAFDDRCSVRTWVYRVGHNVSATHIDRERRVHRGATTLDEIEHLPAPHDISAEHEASEAVALLHALIRQLKHPDRQIVTLYLEGLDAAAISEVIGLSAGAIATRISRLKTHLARAFHETENV